MGYFFTLQGIFYTLLDSFKKENFKFFSFCAFSNVLLYYQKLLTLVLSIFYFILSYWNDFRYVFFREIIFLALEICIKIRKEKVILNSLQIFHLTMKSFLFKSGNLTGNLEGRE